MFFHVRSPSLPLGYCVFLFLGRFPEFGGEYAPGTPKETYRTGVPNTLVKSERPWMSKKVFILPSFLISSWIGYGVQDWKSFSQRTWSGCPIFLVLSLVFSVFLGLQYYSYIWSLIDDFFVFSKGFGIFSSFLVLWNFMTMIPVYIIFGGWSLHCVLCKSVNLDFKFFSSGKCSWLMPFIISFHLPSFFFQELQL